MSEDKTFPSGFEAIQKSKNNIILFGYAGSGKTTLLNKICGENFEVRDTSNPVTKVVQYSYSLRNDNILIDFPGINSGMDIVPILRAQKNVLNIIPVRMICFVVKYSNRYDDMIKAGNQLLMIFRDYRNNICLIITNSENANNKIKEEIELIFKKKFGIDKILFSTLKNGGLELRNFCDRLENYKNQMKSIEKLIIKTSDLTQTIYPEYDFEVMEERDKYVQEFQKALKIFNNEFNKSNNKELKRALYFGLRDYKDSLIKNYNKIIKNKKNDF